ncbi:MAG TPA: hypothetical protein ENI74_05330 [Gammaproteobacteria bacterium]|nr:hypothetical protein [Gammaproteobacteria bacterium]
MKRAGLILATPPLAAYKFGCASCCAAPIGVFWITGIVSIVYGIVGGPTNLMGSSWNTIALGLVLWGIAAVWAAITTRSADEDRCNRRKNRLRDEILPATDESDPFDEVRKAR